MSEGGSASGRRAVLLLAGLALLWAGVNVFTGGITVGPSWLRLSSHNAFRPFLAAVILSGIYLARYRRHWRADLPDLRFPRLLTRIPVPPAIAATCCAAALLIGIQYGTFIGSGPDASGYVSQADLWTHGSPALPVPGWAKEARWFNAAWSSAPVGYRPGVTGEVVPVYSPGLPLMMAAFEIAGGRDAVFYVVPLLGALSVWASYILGRYMGGPWAGAIAAAFMFSSPTFLLFVVQPMSDVAGTACWAMALVFAWRGGTRHAVLAGIATGAAVLVRPNLAPLAAFPAMLLWTTPASRVRRLAIFALAALPAAMLIATLNMRWWGSPLRSGYGVLEDLYAANRIVPNVRQYAGWLVDMQTPLVFLAFAAPWFLSRERPERLRVLILAVGYPAGVLAMYAAYLQFGHVSYLRFLLPAFPAMFAALGAVFVEFARKTRPGALATAAIAAVTASMAIQAWRTAEREGVFTYAFNDRRFARAVDFGNALPANAILISNGHSGTLRFYTGRDVLRWEVLIPSEVDAAITYLRTRGHPLYFIGDTFEVAAFTKQFSGTEIAGDLERRRLPDTGGGFVACDLSAP